MKKLKNFWTLTRRRGGFTLIELIVVIAILAILAGVGTVAYTGYVEKANKQADISLVSDVAQALMLHYYGTGATNGGVVTLTREGVTISDVDRADDFGRDAMFAAFGTEWENGMTLKYEWNKSISDASASTIAPAKLLSTTASLTNVAAAVVGGNSPSTATNIICTLLNGDETMLNELRQYEGSEQYATIATNLMVKYISHELGNVTLDEEGIPNENVTGPSNIALTYAVLYSMANSDSPYAQAAQEKVAAFDAKMLELADKEQEDSTGTSVMSELGMALEQMMSESTVTDLEGNSMPFGEVYGEYFAQHGKTDVSGIVNAMGFVNSVAQSYTDEKSLADDGLYASDTVQNLLADYQNANKYGVVVRIDQNGLVTILPVEANAFEA